MEAALAKALAASTLEAVEAPGAIDAVVVGSGAAGGLAALLLTEAGLRVLVLEAGGPSIRKPRSLSRQLTMNVLLRLNKPKHSSKLLGRVRGSVMRTIGRWRQPIQTRYKEWNVAPDIFVDDRDCPYSTPPNHPFIWVRSRGLGGRMVVPGHGRQYYRLGPDDFVPSDKLSPAWPLKVGELDHWYAFVERRLKIAGEYDGVPWLPDSELTSLLEPNEGERALQRAIIARWPNAQPVMGRFAAPIDGLEAAAKTGRLFVRQGAIARQVVIDGGRTVGIDWIDLQDGGWRRIHTPLVFLCASTLETTRLLLLSLGERSGRVERDGYPNALGRYLMDHIKVSLRGFTVGASADHRAQGRCLYLPRFDARALSDPPAGRGFGVQVYQSPLKFGSVFRAAAFGEMTPRPENRVTLDPQRKDAWHIPILRIDCALDDSEKRLAREEAIAIRELAKVAEAKFVSTKLEPLGTASHECGAVRMGVNPSNSVLDPNNECWTARGLYVTDGASFPSQGIANPTLTIMALTARACDHAIRSNKGRDESEASRRPMGERALAET